LKRTIAENPKNSSDLKQSEKGDSLFLISSSSGRGISIERKEFCEAKHYFKTAGRAIRLNQVKRTCINTIALLLTTVIKRSITRFGHFTFTTVLKLLESINLAPYQ